ncbi:membrane hypothetical protein [Nostocoides jenkinsii Ben 74]|uniref:Uncharacterized protein n=2 Tax=Nostocoides jenkinsii TaxID=330834 RepID=A0A077MEA2_9MICO|nr:membrane hypothetical protein [Tetrasphaera jenkinsii Ben 74]
MLAKITTTTDASGQAVTVSAVALDLTPAEMLAWYADVKTKRAPQGWTYHVADGHVVGTGPGQCGEPLTVSTTRRAIAARPQPRREDGLTWTLRQLRARERPLMNPVTVANHTFVSFFWAALLLNLSWIVGLVIFSRRFAVRIANGDIRVESIPLLMLTTATSVAAACVAWVDDDSLARTVVVVILANVAMWSSVYNFPMPPKRAPS